MNAHLTRYWIRPLEAPVTLLDIATTASELTDRHQHIERIWDRDRHRNRRMRHVHVTTQDGLLQQLADAVYAPASPDDNGGGRPVPGSKPPGAFEALARHVAITAEVTRWCWDLRLDLRSTVEDNIRALVGKAAELDPDQTATLLADLRRWHGQAAAMTGWAARSFSPRALCPVVDCGRSNTLRVNLDRSVATCMACGSVWDDTDGSFAALARHVEHTTTTTINTPVRLRSGKQGHGGWHGEHVTSAAS
ncbi:hypothetical protein ABGB07_03820 [Micromonosporaceae bacterium B7E4]